MLDQFKQVHEEMLGLIDLHEQLTRSQTPVMNDIAPLRLQLIEANRRRIDMLDQIYEMLGDDVPEAVRNEVADYRAEDREMLAAASRHIGTWTLDRIRDEWTVYQQACTAAYARQRRRIHSEQALIYPYIG